MSVLLIAQTLWTLLLFLSRTHVNGSRTNLLAERMSILEGRLSGDVALLRKELKTEVEDLMNTFVQSKNDTGNLKVFVDHSVKVNQPLVDNSKNNDALTVLQKAFTTEKRLVRAVYNELRGKTQTNNQLITQTLSSLT